MTTKEIKKVKLSEIKTPTSVEEFRDNLKKYFAGYDEGLFVQERTCCIKYEDINSFDDIYKATKKGFTYGAIGDSPKIIPLIEYDVDALVVQNGRNRLAWEQDMSNWLWFHDDFEVYENKPGIIHKMKNPMWLTLDNTIMREFYMHVLGEYAGYGLLSDYAPTSKEVA